MYEGKSERGRRMSKARGRRTRAKLKKSARTFPIDGGRNDTLLVWVSDGPKAAKGHRPTRSDLKGKPIAVRGGHKYVVGDVIAQGGMGLVYRARDIRCDRVVALKVLRSAGTAQDENRRQFVSEARITSRLEHPNIVPIHELGTSAAGQAFYSMKFVEGIALSEVLERIRKKDRAIADQFPLARLLTVFQKVCDAIAFAHARRILHRDLKPANIMIGDYGEVLLLDWGLARPIHDPEEPAAGGSPDDRPAPATATPLDTDGLLDTLELATPSSRGSRRHGAVVGTPGYLAPELLSPAAPPDLRSDVYSLGAILYSILTLHTPVRDKTLRKVLHRILKGNIPPATSFNDTPEELPHCPDSRIPLPLSEIAAKAMAVNPAERYASVRELQQEVEAFQNGLVWHLVIDEDFSDPALVQSRWEVFGGHHEIANGELRLHGGEPQLLLLKRDMPTEVRIEFECRQEGTYLNDLACLINGKRMGSPWGTSTSGYAFKYGAYTNTFTVLTRCDQKLWSQTMSPLRSGQTYHVLVERIGARLRMFVDEKPVLDVEDSQPLTGSDHCLVGVLGWIADTRYTRIKVFSLGTPWKSDILDYAERHLYRKHYATAREIFQDILDSFPDAERMERARRGYQAAEQQELLARKLIEWQTQIASAWPHLASNLRLTDRGLAMYIPPGEISDLAPLQGIPLIELQCSMNRISSLEPLRGMPLQLLAFVGNSITDPEPLSGMPLIELHCAFNQIRSLEPLRGMPLARLSCTADPLEDGLNPLSDLPLTWLHCAECCIDTLEPLRGMELTMLFCDANRIENLEPLRGMRLTELACSGNRIRNLEPLTGMPLNDLNCAENQICSLAPLKGAPLSTLKCQGNVITTLEPLRGMPLSTVMCGANALTSLVPFAKAPPRNFWFDCDSISTGELEWAHRTWSRDFRFTAIAKEVGVLLAFRKSDTARLRALASKFQGRDYLYIPKYLTWAEARKLCEAHGGHLVTITSREENDFVSSLFTFGASWIWIGIETIDRRPRWITGEPFAFHAFRERIDQERPGPKTFRSGQWCYDIVPDPRHTFVIEWNAP